MKTILVVDDNKETTDMVKLMLELNNYSCTTVNSAGECLKAIRESKFDLILLDMAMPVMNGLQVLQKLKKESMLAENKIVLFTASLMYTDMDLEKIKNNFGAVDRIRKPFTEKELIHIIEIHTA
jgi:CheY-like chemotaxis protein